MKRSAVPILVFILFLFLPSNLLSQSWTPNDYQDVVKELESKGVPEKRAESILSDSRVKFYPDIMDMFDVEVDTTSTYNPYDKFKRPQSVQAGKDFLRKNSQLLARAEKKFGVPREVFTAFLRVESNFGSHTGYYQALGVFASIIRYGESDTARISWAKDELVALIQIAEDSNRNVFDFNSSYAGAFGLPQFMPTSFLDFAADGNGDGRINLYNMEDAVWSIGSYLVAHGWHRDEEEAVFAYNHSDNFVECILDYADLLGR